MNRSLSSTMTILPTVVLPLFMGWILVGAIFGAYQERNVFHVVVVLPFIAITFWFSWRIYFVSTDGERLFFRSYRESGHVLLSEILSVKALSRSKTPRIEIEFKREGDYTKTILLLPPVEFSLGKFWDTYDFLADYAIRADHDVPDGENPRGRARTYSRIVVVVWALILIAVLGLVFCGVK